MTLRLLRAAGACVGLSLMLADAALTQDRRPEPVVQERSSSMSHDRMVEALADVADRTADENPWLGDREVRDLREQIAGLGARAKALRRVRLGRRLGESLLRVGRVEEAIESLESARALLESSSAAKNSAERREVWFKLGVAHLRQAEDANCVCEHCGSSCIHPFVAEAIHGDPEGATRAVECFARVLEFDPGDLAARWLVNLAAAALGRPEAVAEGLRIAPSTFERGPTLPPFAEAAHELGLATFNLSGGVVVDDFDGDGDLDILTSTFDAHGGMHFFRNEEGSWKDQSERAGLTGLLGGLNMVQADYDNDGWVDVFVLRGAWLGEGGRHPNSLLRNLGDGRFEDLSFDAGLAEVHYPTQTAAWADYDNDGDVDLYVGNEERAGRGYPNQLFRNEGDGTFVDVAAKAGVSDLRYTKGVTWGDYDGDGDPDLFLSNLGAANRLYQNLGTGAFRDVAVESGVDRPHQSFPTWFWDFDNDGRLDLFVSNYHPEVSKLASGYLGGDESFEPPAVYRGTADGGFESVAESMGLNQAFSPMGANFGDFDYDGNPDFYLGTGSPWFETLVPNLLFWNRGGVFADVTASTRTGHLQKGHGVAFADLDADGDQDLFAQMGGSYPADEFFDAVFLNPGFGHHRIEVRVEGVESNRSGIGARIRVTVGSEGAERDVYARVNSGGSFGARSLCQEIGVADADRIARLEVFWPTSGRRDVFEDLPVDHRYTVVEGSEVLGRLALAPPGASSAALERDD